MAKQWHVRWFERGKKVSRSVSWVRIAYLILLLQTQTIVVVVGAADEVAGLAEYTDFGVDGGIHGKMRLLFLMGFGFDLLLLLLHVLKSEFGFGFGFNSSEVDPDSDPCCASSVPAFD